MVNSELWQAADAAFDQLLDLSPDARDAALKMLPVAVRNCVLQLFAAHSVQGVLDRRPELPPPSIPEQIGPWRIGEVLGRGGMSVVFRAERRLGETRQVAALKLLTVGALIGGGRDRFLQEREVLARLHHPHIAQLLDAGVMHDGTPWLAMELVEGRRIDEWCAEQGLDTRAICRLAVDLCEAVDYAHRQLVVHRDIKPGNVLIDASGHVRLLDFGIAKWLEGADGSDATSTGLRAFTPDYAAPEQLAAEPASTANDVYGIGALLYRLLVGHPPRGHSAAGSREPTLPSQAAAQNSNVPEATRLLRQRQLRGDLDLILCKALAREATHRYASPRAFSDDIHRWMRAEPILARAPSLPYRLRKFTRRNRVLVGASGLIAVLLVMAVAGIVRERNTALEQARRAETVRDFLTQVFLSTEPSKGDIPDAIDILNEGSHRARDELLQSDPRTAADVLIVTGMARRAMSDTARSRDDLETALGVLVALPHPPARELMHVHWELASLYKVIGPIETALEHGQLAVSWARKWPASATERIGVAMTFASIVSIAGDATVAEQQLRALRDDIESNDLKNTQLHLDILNSLSTAMVLAKRPYVETLPIHEERIGVVRALYGENSGWYAYTLADAVPSFRNAGQLVRAEQLAREAVAIADRIYDKPDALAAVPYCNLGALLMQIGRLREALPYYDRAIAIDEAISRNNLHAESCRSGRAYVRAALGQRDAALADLTAERDMLQKLGRERSVQWLNICGLEATLALRNGNLAQVGKDLEICFSAHHADDTANLSLYTMAQAELAFRRGATEDLKERLDTLMKAVPPDTIRRRWLRPWMLGTLAAASVDDAEWRARLLAVARPAFDALPGVWDMRSRVAACFDAMPPTADDCLSLP